MIARPFQAIAFSGSLRAGSTNTGLVRLAQELAMPDLEVRIIDWVVELPWMNPDLEADPPLIVQRWWAELRAADALIVGMPEYNSGQSALAKNALDWASRPPHDRAIAGTVVAFLSSAGGSGGANSQGAIGTMFGHLGATVVTDPPVQLQRVGDRFDAQGNTTDPEIIEAVAAKMRAVVDALRARATPPTS